MSLYPHPKRPSKPVPASEGRQATLFPSLPSKGTRTQPGPDGNRPHADTGDTGGRRRGGGAPQARPDAATAPSSSRLDTGTICDRADGKPPEVGYRVLLRDYGTGLVEATATVKRYAQRPRPASGTPQPLTNEQREENRKRALRRARTAIRQSIMAAKLDHLMTLTYRANQTCPRLAWQHFARFTRLVRKRLGKAFAYVAVLERQKRGAIHIHAAVHGYQDVKLLRATWHEVIGGTDKGGFDVQWMRQNLAVVARYLSKYISKDLDTKHSQGDHRYKRSRGIAIPAVTFLLPFSVAIDEKLLELFDLHGAVIVHHINELHTEGPKWLWACSWGLNGRRPTPVRSIVAEG